MEQAPPPHPHAPDAPLDPGPDYVRAGLLSGIASGVFGGVCGCCCISIPVAGALSATLSSKRTAYFGLQEGLATGACGGAVAWLVQAAITVPQLLLLERTVPPELLEQVRTLPPILQQALTQQPTPAHVLMSQALMLVLYVLGAALAGGIAGATSLRKEPPAEREAPGAAVQCPACAGAGATLAGPCAACGGRGWVQPR